MPIPISNKESTNINSTNIEFNITEINSKGVVETQNDSTNVASNPIVISDDHSTNDLQAFQPLLNSLTNSVFSEYNIGGVLVYLMWLCSIR